MEVKGIQVWGDSVLKGVVFDPLRRRYVLLRESAIALVSRQLATPVENCSRMGRTAPQGLEAMRSMPPEAMRDQLVVLEYGGNDCDFDWKQVDAAPEAGHQPHTPVAAFEAVLRELVDYVRACGGIPILCTLPPLDAGKYFSWITRGLKPERILSFLGKPERIYHWQELYNFVILRVAQAAGCPCVPLRERFLCLVRGEEVLCEDGIHPNAQGHLLLAQGLLEGARLAGVH